MRGGLRFHGQQHVRVLSLCEEMRKACRYIGRPGTKRFGNRYWSRSSARSRPALCNTFETTPSAVRMPSIWVERQGRRASCSRIVESALIVQASVPKQAGEHGQRARCECLVDERLLAFKSFGRRTARKRIFSFARVHDLRVELGDGSQPVCPSTVESVEWLSEYKLTACRIVAQVEPIADRRGSGDDFLDDLTGSTCVHATNDHVGTAAGVSERCFAQELGTGLPTIMRVLACGRWFFSSARRDRPDPSTRSTRAGWEKICPLMSSSTPCAC